MANIISSVAIGQLLGAGVNELQSILSPSPTRQILWQSTDVSGQQALDQFGRPLPAALFPQVVIEEKHEDELRLTKHPVEQGAVITDHAYKLPARVQLRAAWSLSPSGGLLSIIPSFDNPNYLSGLYDVLRGIQTNRSIVTLVTGKRLYTNLLLQSLSVTTDEKTENALVFLAAFEEVIFAQTALVTIPDASLMKNPSVNAGTTDLGTTYPLSGNSANIPALTPLLPTDLL